MSGRLREISTWWPGRSPQCYRLASGPPGVGVRASLRRGELAGHASQPDPGGLIEATGDLVSACGPRPTCWGRRRRPPATRARRAQGGVGQRSVAGRCVSRGNIRTVSLVREPSAGPGRREDPGGTRCHRAGSLFTSVLAAAAVGGSQTPWPIHGRNASMSATSARSSRNGRLDVAAHLEALSRHNVSVDVVYAIRVVECHSAIGYFGPGYPLTDGNALVHSPSNWRKPRKSAGIMSKRKKVG